MAESPSWEDRDHRTPTRRSQWGRDHWSLLLYVETRNVDRGCEIDWDQVTLSRRNWPTLHAARAHADAPGAEDAADRYGLRVVNRDREPVTRYGHCEVDALMDFAENGLVTIEMPRPAAPSPDRYLRWNGKPLPDGLPESVSSGALGARFLMPWAAFPLTDLGWNLAGQLRTHRARGGTDADFTPADGFLEGVRS
jgi:hypothetical protein